MISKRIWLSIFATLCTTAVIAMDPRCGDLRANAKPIPMMGQGWFSVRPDENAIKKWMDECRYDQICHPSYVPNIKIDCRSCEELKQEADKVNRSFIPRPVNQFGGRGKAQTIMGGGVDPATQKWRDTQNQLISQRRKELKCD